MEPEDRFVEAQPVGQNGREGRGGFANLCEPCVGRAGSTVVLKKARWEHPRETWGAGSELLTAALI